MLTKDSFSFPSARTSPPGVLAIYPQCGRLQSVPSRIAQSELDTLYPLRGWRSLPVLDSTEEDVLFPSPAVRRECLIDAYLFGGCSPQNFTLSLDKFPSRVSSMVDLIDLQLPVPENCWKIPGSWKLWLCLSPMMIGAFQYLMNPHQSWFLLWTWPFSFEMLYRMSVCGSRTCLC